MVVFIFFIITHTIKLSLFIFYIIIVIDEINCMNVTILAFFISLFILDIKLIILYHCWLWIKLNILYVLQHMSFDCQN